jgi:hypothetical protein
MNNRIQELMKQANLQPYYDSQEKDIEKFALLIVQECADIVRHINCQGTDLGTIIERRVLGERL